MFYCHNCGKEINESQEFCPFCGIYIPWPMILDQVDYQEESKIYQREMPPRSTYQPSYTAPTTPPGVWKNKWTSILLCFFLGVFGAHRFYEGKIGTGILYFCTAGIGGIGVLIDLIILFGKPSIYQVK